MISLFIDTSDKIIIGLLDKDNHWIEYIKTGESKGSKVLHSIINKILEKNDIGISSIINVITVAGPGSYTGLRLAEGFGQILALNKTKHYSLYLTDIFNACNIDNASFLANAFKNEIYYFSKNGVEEISRLITLDELSKMDCTGWYSINGDYGGKIIAELIQKRSPEIFNYVIKNKLKQKIFYYRTLDEEFKRV